MGTYNLNISRHNFKQQRQCYNITVKEIADICNLSPQTVINFEKSSGKYTDTNARDYNSDMMCQTLDSLITRKLDDLKANNLKAVIEHKETVDISKAEVPEKKPIKRRNQSEVKRKDLVNYIRAYCEYNKIPLQEFCSMCKINAVYTSPSQERCASSEYASNTVLSKVINATGWTIKQIENGFKPEEEKTAFKMKLADKKKPDIPKHGDIVKKPDDSDVRKECTDVAISNGGAKLADLNTTNRTITNVKYVCENGKFYKEYDVITHMKLDISRDTFLKEISGGDQS